MMSSPRHYCLISASIIIISVIAAATVVDAFSVPNPATVIFPPAANAIIPHRPSGNYHQQISRRAKMTLNSLNNNDRDEDIVSSSFFDRATTLIGKSASSLVSLSFFILLATKRDGLTTTLFIGSILNAIVGKILKKILNHDRPAELELSDKVKLKPSDGGMPSSHAMSLSFIGTVILFGVIAPAAANNISISIAAGALMVIYSAIALRYRVRDHLHTLDQIIVGYVLGLFNAFVWLRFAVSTNHGDTAGPILTLVRRYMISSETNQFPLVGLVVPVLVGVLVVGSFERRIGVWLKERKQTDEEDVEEKTK